MRALVFAVAFSLPLHATIVGRNTPAESLTAARVNAILSANKRAPWLAYIRRSEQQRKVDQAALAAERRGLPGIPPLPRQGPSARALPLHREPAFYASPEGRRLGDIVISFQTPAGGWSKNLAMDAPRAPGQSYATANLAPVASGPGDFDEPHDPNWHYIGTLDNDATNTELHFLALLSAANPGHDGDPYRASFLRGMRYLLNAQFPNGGWPQVWPLEGGYHDAITFNDDAVTESAELLADAATGQRITTRPSAEELAFAQSPYAAANGESHPPQAAVEDFTFVPPPLRAEARQAVEKAIHCILITQLRVPAPDGKGTVLAVWPQQSDPLTLAPVSARNFEPPALSAGESASVMEFLMSLPHPSPEVVRSVEAAATWFQAHKITGYAWVGGRNTPGGRHLEPKPGAGPLWPRYTSLTTGEPIFGDRDKTIHDNVMEISLERRNGYNWYTRDPEEALAQYANWSESLQDGCMGAQYADPSVRKNPPCAPDDHSHTKASKTP